MASQVIQQFIQANSDKKHKTSALLPLGDGNPPVTGGFLSQRVSNAESDTMSWRHLVASSSLGFLQNHVHPPFSSVDVYQLMCHLLGVTPHPHNGTWSHVVDMLRRWDLKKVADILQTTFSNASYWMKIIILFRGVQIENRPTRVQGLYSQSGKTSYRHISRSLEATRLDFIMIVLFCNLAGISTAQLPRCLSNLSVTAKV